MSNYPQSKTPEYKTWSLDKLQREYFSLRLELSATKMKQYDIDEKLQVIDTFLDAFTALNDLVATDRKPK